MGWRVAGRWGGKYGRLRIQEDISLQDLTRFDGEGFTKM
jgi:hypothetical protein